MPRNAEQLILIVDDEPRMAELVAYALEAQGFGTRRAGNADEALDVLLSEHVSLVILDIMMPGVSGLDLCERIRRDSQLPIVLLSALGSDHERIRGLEAGADDYVTKPFSPRELGLRVAAVLRRTDHPRGQVARGPTVRVGRIDLDQGALRAHWDGVDLHLSPAEFRILWALASQRATTVGWRDLHRLLHDDESAAGREAVRTAVYRLRQRLEPVGSPRILTDWGRGYRLVD